MNCPDCGNERTRVIDTATSTDGTAIRRRREWHRRSLRFTTSERPEWVSPRVKNRDTGTGAYSRVVSAHTEVSEPETCRRERETALGVEADGSGSAIGADRSPHT
ncbi:hypothetical protein [Natrinema pallidum]|uniref:NrdR family transcriptional regulator n=1 Tax=Natrinema pallidum TaxID=69527 RepID=UPI00373AF215